MIGVSLRVNGSSLYALLLPEYNKKDFKSHLTFVCGKNKDIFI